MPKIFSNVRSLWRPTLCLAMAGILCVTGFPLDGWALPHAPTPFAAFQSEAVSPPAIHQDHMLQGDYEILEEESALRENPMTPARKRSLRIFGVLTRLIVIGAIGFAMHPLSAPDIPPSSYEALINTSAPKNSSRVPDFAGLRYPEKGPTEADRSHVADLIAEIANLSKTFQQTVKIKKGIDVLGTLVLAPWIPWASDHYVMPPFEEAGQNDDAYVHTVADLIVRQIDRDLSANMSSFPISRKEMEEHRNPKWSDENQDWLFEKAAPAYFARFGYFFNIRTVWLQGRNLKEIEIRELLNHEKKPISLSPMMRGPFAIDVIEVGASLSPLWHSYIEAINPPPDASTLKNSSVVERLPEMNMYFRSVENSIDWGMEHFPSLWNGGSISSHWIGDPLKRARLEILIRGWHEFTKSPVPVTAVGSIALERLLTDLLDRHETYHVLSSVEGGIFWNETRAMAVGAASPRGARLQTADDLFSLSLTDSHDIHAAGLKYLFEQELLALWELQRDPTEHRSNVFLKPVTLDDLSLEDRAALLDNATHLTTAEWSAINQRIFNQLGHDVALFSKDQTFTLPAFPTTWTFKPLGMAFLAMLISAYFLFLPDSILKIRNHLRHRRELRAAA